MCNMMISRHRTTLRVQILLLIGCKLSVLGVQIVIDRHLTPQLVIFTLSGLREYDKVVNILLKILSTLF